MSEAADRGITVTEIPAVDQPIDATPETRAAFIGRALRGPLSTPVFVNSFGQFRRRFGGIWRRSSLGPAVRQFFEHGGRELCIVRVANDALGATICLPAGGSVLTLRAAEPGSTERVRAAVDYDGIDEHDDELFNLTVQRICPESQLVTDQELYRRVGFRDGSRDFIGDALMSSSIVRIDEPFPERRPDPTRSAGEILEHAYIDAAHPGTDGRELTDYDLIGSREERTGLFALQGVEHLDLLYLPPPGKYTETGPTALLAAELYCRERGAMLIADPSASWQSAPDAVAGVRSTGLASPNIVTYFPRVRSRSDQGSGTKVAGGAIAGLLCKLDRIYGPWHELGVHGLALSRDLVPASDLDDSDLRMLTREGINSVLCGTSRRTSIQGSVTLGRGSEANRMFASLPIRRLCLKILHAVDRATRWAVFEPHVAALSLRLSKQVRTYLGHLYELGAFDSDRFVVQCDAGVARHDDELQHGVTILLGFQPRGSDQPLLLTLHQTAYGCRLASAAFAPVELP